MEFDEKQLEAINLSLNMDNRLVGVTGKAGTGKTSLILTIAEQLSLAGYAVVLCAPTGKAAKRITEVSGLEAKTIHRLLEYPFPGERDPKTGKALQSGVPTRSSSKPLDYDVIIADEYAMVNLEIHRNLLAAIPRGGVLRVFGDVNQLRPIEKAIKARKAPSSFSDILSRFPSVELEYIHRQGAGSGISVNGEAILAGRMPKRFDDFKLHYTTQPLRMLEKLVEGEIDYSTIDNQVISPTNKGWVGCSALNEAMQRWFQPSSAKYIPIPRHSWAKTSLKLAVRDKVIWTENDYNINIMNGEAGIIVNVDDEYDTIHIDFGDRVVEVPPEIMYQRGKQFLTYDPRKSLELAYAITTHKSQGSEYKNVVYLINKSNAFIQCRPNLYTGITRAREAVHLVTDQQSIIASTRREVSLIEQKESK